MIRFSFFIFVISLTLFGSVDKKIEKTSKELNSYSKNYKELNKKMAKTAEAILKQKRKIIQQEKQIAALEKELQEKSSSYKENKKQLQELLSIKTKLKKKADKFESDLTFVIAKSVSLSIILDEQYGHNEKSLMELEVLKAKLKEYKDTIKKLNKEFYNTVSTITVLSSQAKKLKASIDEIDAKKKKLLAMQKKTKKDLKNLKIAKASYKKELKKLLKKQDELKRTLAKLNIIKMDEERRRKEEEQRRKAFAQKKSLESKNLPKVKKYGKSYQKIKTRRYTGKKTIPPLKHYTITKKYGTYTDPIYGIKVFNESISLKPKEKNARVRNVFNGKVIYADKTAVLNNIVIVEHKNGLHTIYANLSKISPYIKKGKRIKKGYVIGRVKDELIFEVTQKSLHVNPVELFR